MSKGTILISVTNKTDLKKFAALQREGWRILSTGGTMKELQRLGIECTSVEEITGFPEMMNGRLKTLHPKIHGGILADRAKMEHLEMATAHGIPLIDVVVVNLYDFSGNPSIEQIDIGGPTMIRGAAKNGASVSVLVDPEDYDELINQLVADGATHIVFRQMLAQKAFAHVAAYDTAIAQWMYAGIQQGLNIFEPLKISPTSH